MIPGLAVTTPRIRSSRLSRLDAAPWLGLVVLAIISSLVFSGWILAALTLLAMGLLTRTGLGLGAQIKNIRPWVFLALVVVLIHALTTTRAAPVGHFSWLGVVAGL